VQREVESGISQRVPLADLIRDKLRSLRELTLGEWAGPLAIGVAVLGLLLLLLLRGRHPIAALLFVGVRAPPVYRRFRNRRYRLLKRITSKVRKMSEVRIIAADGQRVTVVADKALAKTYVRINALVDALNAKMYFGEPFSVVVRDDVGPEENRA